MSLRLIPSSRCRRRRRGPSPSGPCPPSSGLRCLCAPGGLWTVPPAGLGAAASPPSCLLCTSPALGRPPGRPRGAACPYPAWSDTGLILSLCPSLPPGRGGRGVCGGCRNQQTEQPAPHEQFLQAQGPAGLPAPTSCPCARQSGGLLQPPGPLAHLPAPSLESPAASSGGRGWRCRPGRGWMEQVPQWPSPDPHWPMP